MNARCQMSHSHFDVFNGDADGLCALQQLRLANPQESQVVTGTKRDQVLLPRVKANPGDSVTVVDLPLGPNLDALLGLLEGGVCVEYFDHHHAAQVPEHRLLRLSLDPAPTVCSSVLVDRYLNGRFRLWAIVGAFGDNMFATANALADSIGLSAGRTKLLRSLGECLNYNAYGDSVKDLAMPPAQVHRSMATFIDPFDFMVRTDIYVRLARHWAEDIMLADNVSPVLESERLVVTVLPDAAWARRVIGAHANCLVNRYPERVCVSLVPNHRSGVTVSLRTPAGSGITADQLARRYGGDGRSTAAGINNLPLDDVSLFLRSLQ
jgi:hypothetical protein